MPDGAFGPAGTGIDKTLSNKNFGDKVLDLPAVGSHKICAVLHQQCQGSTVKYLMNRFLKTLLLWLLLATLPLQGMAAAMQAGCGLPEHGGSADKTMSVQGHHHGGDVTKMAGMDEADDGAAMSHDKSSGEKHEHARCGTCPACFAGAFAPPSAAVVTAAHRSSLPSVAAPAPFVAGFVPAGLERPPRRITA